MPLGADLEALGSVGEAGVDVRGGGRELFEVFAAAKDEFRRIAADLYVPDGQRLEDEFQIAVLE